MRIVIDTNVLVSAIFFGGKPQEIVELAYQQRVTAVASPEIVEEYQETIDELARRFSRTGTDHALVRIVASFDVVEISRKVAVCRDPDDDKFLSCAAEGKCLYIVSGDKDLLSVGTFEGVEVVTVTEFLERFSQIDT